MNLSPSWVSVFMNHGIGALHWSAIGNRGATDREIMQWAFENHAELETGAILTIDLARSKIRILPIISNPR
jgi:predicted nuclease of predicted toxin-antitoxin system